MKFKCIQSGVVVEMIQQVDIDTTLQNPAYIPVVEEETIVVEKKTDKKSVKG